MSSRREIAFRAIAVLLGGALPLGLTERIAAWLISSDPHRCGPVPPEEIGASVNLDDRRPDPSRSDRWLPLRPNLAGETLRADKDDCHRTPVGQQRLAERISGGWILAQRGS
jgi:hypothetical protein